MVTDHRCLQAWSYQGNARIIGDPYTFNLGFSVIDTVQWRMIYLPCPQALVIFLQAPVLLALLTTVNGLGFGSWLLTMLHGFKLANAVLYGGPQVH